MEQSINEILKRNKMYKRRIEELELINAKFL